MIFGHGSVMLLQGMGKIMGPVVLRYKIKEIDVGGMQGGVQGFETWVGNGPLGQAADLVRIIGGFQKEILLLNSLSFGLALIQYIDCGGVALQGHASLKPVMKNGGNQPSFLVVRSFFFYHGSKNHYFFPA